MMEYFFLEKELNELEKMITWEKIKNPLISSVSIGWHIAHTLKVILLITSTLEKSNPKDYKKNFNFIRTFAFLFSYIPRKKAQSSPEALPEGEITPKMLDQQFHQVEKAIITLVDLPPNKHFHHFVFGNLNLQQAKIFIKIHTLHHLKIIRDILRQK